MSTTMNTTARWWDYLDAPPRWVTRCPFDGDLILNRPTDQCPHCDEPVTDMGRYTAPMPPTLFGNSTVCRDCGDDLLTQPGLLQRCRDLHRPNRKAAA